MRALIRVDLHTHRNFPKITDRAKYDKPIVELFQDLGYSPRPTTGQEPAISNDAQASPLTAPGNASNDNPPGSGDADWIANQKHLAESAEVKNVFGDVPDDH